MARARDLDERHAALRLELKARRDACASFERAAEPWHAPDDPRKARWFAAREALATAESEARTLADRTLFAHEEAVESAVLAGDAGSARRARDEFLLARLIESEIDRDADEVRRMTLALEDSPLAAKVKGSGRLTLATFPAGAEVTIHRCEEAADGRLLARGGEPLARATSPIEAMALSAGSYVARITCSGRQTLLYPFLIERDEHWGDPQWHGGRFAEKDWRVELPATADYDGARFVFVPAGPYQATADPDEDGLSPRLEWRWEDGFLIQRFEATMRDYRDFVEAPETYRAMARAFQIQGMRGRFLPRLSSQEPMESLPEGESVEAPVRVSSITVDTDAEQIRVVEADLDVAMHGTSQAEIVEFCSWLSIRSGWTYSLPTASQWQKAARGVDGRSFPWGNRFDWSFLRVDPSAAQSADRPGIGGKTPADESPYGLFDMAGNAREWCSDGPNLPEAFVNPWLAGGDSSPLSSSPRAFVTWPLDYFAFSNLSGNWGFRMTRSLRRTR